MDLLILCTDNQNIFKSLGDRESRVTILSLHQMVITLHGSIDSLLGARQFLRDSQLVWQEGRSGCLELLPEHLSTTFMPSNASVFSRIHCIHVESKKTSSGFEQICFYSRFKAFLYGSPAEPLIVSLTRSMNDCLLNIIIIIK